MVATIDLVIVSGVETQVVVTFTGREEEGHTVQIGLADIILDDGSSLNARRGHTDGRTAALWFDPVPEGRHITSVELDRVTLADVEFLLDPADGVNIGSFSIEVEPHTVQDLATNEWQVEASQSFGAGTLSIDSARYADGTLLLYGRFSALALEEPFHGSFDGVTLVLMLPGGSSVTPQAILVHGDPANPTAFEMQFNAAALDPGTATLTIRGTQPWDGAPATATLVFPIP